MMVDMDSIDGPMIFRRRAYPSKGVLIAHTKESVLVLWISSWFFPPRYYIAI
jgi:hypothetical protein